MNGLDKPKEKRLCPNKVLLIETFAFSLHPFEEKRFDIKRPVSEDFWNEPFCFGIIASKLFSKRSF